MKANAYGLGCAEIATSIVDLVDSFAVATICEGEALCNLRLGKDIYVLGGIDYDEIASCTADIIHSVTSTADIEYLAKLSAKFGRKYRISLKINSGMNRLGAIASDARAVLKAISKANVKAKSRDKTCSNAKIIDKAKLKNLTKQNKLSQHAELSQQNKLSQQTYITEQIELVSIFTHFSCGDNVDISAVQYDKFGRAIDNLSCDNLIIHACASSVLSLPSYGNMYRVGIAMYGYGDSAMKPALTLHTNIVQVFKVGRGEFIGYGRTYQAEQNMTIATIRIGYADGLMRFQPKARYVEIRGKRAQVVGNICMDMCMVDVTAIRGVTVRDRAYIVSENLPAEVLADSCNTIVYEVLTSISRRAVRKYSWTKNN